MARIVKREREREREREDPFGTFVPGRMAGGRCVERSPCRASPGPQVAR